MASLNEQIGYLRGLIGGMNLEAESVNAKLLTGLMDALEGILSEIEETRDGLNELNDFVESIDEDLEDLEATVDGDAHDPGDDGDFDDDEFEDDYEDETLSSEGGLRVLRSDAEKQDKQSLAGSICPACGKLFFVPLDELEPEELYECPHCEKPVVFSPLGPENAPIAKPVGKE